MAGAGEPLCILRRALRTDFHPQATVPYPYLPDYDCTRYNPHASSNHSLNVFASSSNVCHFFKSILGAISKPHFCQFQVF